MTALTTFDHFTNPNEHQNDIGEKGVLHNSEHKQRGKASET